MKKLQEKVFQTTDVIALINQIVVVHFKGYVILASQNIQPGNGKERSHLEKKKRIGMILFTVSKHVIYALLCLQ